MMSAVQTLPRAALPFVEFASVLRENGFVVAPDQTQSFISAIGLLGPRGMDDIHRAALSTLAPSPEQREEFDALFRMVFLGQTIAAAASDCAEDDELRAFDQRDGQFDPPDIGDDRESGAEATGLESLTGRQFSAAQQTRFLAKFKRNASEILPRHKARRFSARSKGTRPDVRQALREAVKRDGEVIRLPVRGRKQRQRRILLLIDVSGSMKELTDGHLRFAHALAQTAERLEVFTIGTRLTRVTRALKLKNREHSFQTASAIVSDWDGGTRLGDALNAFLAIPRFVGFARGSLTIVVSDGLERGDSQELRAAMERFARIAWSILWLTPLADGPNFVPQTSALVTIAGHVDRFDSAVDLEHLCDAVLDHARRKV